jgi:hypothetical protein
MNPFHFDPAFAIPVPGRAATSCSVEAVWQGLKIVDGRTDEAMFTRPPEKRPADRSDPAYVYSRSVFSFGEAVIDLVTARHLIYLPAYLFALDRLVEDAVVREILDALASGLEVVFYDWDANFDITDPASSFSHSAILASFYEGTLEEAVLAPARRVARSLESRATEDLLERHTARYRALAAGGLLRRRTS